MKRALTARVISSFTLASLLFFLSLILSPKAEASTMPSLSSGIALDLKFNNVKLKNNQQTFIQTMQDRIENKTAFTANTTQPPVLPAPIENTTEEKEESAQLKLDPTPTKKIEEIAKVEEETTTFAAAQITPLPVVSAEIVMPSLTPPAATETSLNGDFLLDLVNAYRKQAGLAAFEKEDKLCELAQSRAYESYNEIFISNSMHSGLYNRNLPYFIWENLIYQNTEHLSLAWWINSPIHHRGLMSDYKYGCCRCSGKACSLLMTSYTPKVLPTPTPTPLRAL